MRYEVVNSRTGETVVRDALMADSPLVRMRGLLGKKSLPEGEGIILKPASSIHTLFMRFAIDVLYLDRANTVVKIVPNLVPNRFSAARGAHSVIELASGALSGLELQPGDSLALQAVGSSAGSTKSNSG